MGGAKLGTKRIAMIWNKVIYILIKENQTLLERRCFPVDEDIFGGASKHLAWYIF